MRTSNNKIYVLQGETFTLDKILEQRNGEPYVITSEMNHPFLVITIRDTLYEQNKSYAERWFLDLDKRFIPRFGQVEPIDVTKYVPGWTDSNDPDISPFDLLANNMRPNVVGISPNDNDFEYLFFVIRYDNDGFEWREYRYWRTGDTNAAGTNWFPYVFRIVKQFGRETVKQWKIGKYFWDMVIVDGVLKVDNLRAIAESFGKNPETMKWNVDISEVYKRDEFNNIILDDDNRPILVGYDASVQKIIIRKIQEYVDREGLEWDYKDNDMNNPIHEVFEKRIILEPTLLQVDSSLFEEGGKYKSNLVEEDE